MFLVKVWWYYHNGLQIILSQTHKCFGSKYIIIKHNTAIITGLNTYNAMHAVVNYITISAAKACALAAASIAALYSLGR